MHFICIAFSRNASEIASRSKRGVQNRKAEAGTIARVPAPEIETLVYDGVRRHLAATPEAVPQPPYITARRERSRPHAGVLLVRQTIQANGFRMHRIRYCHLSQSGPRRIDLESDYISKN
jgi:hypothetical protein